MGLEAEVQTLRHHSRPALQWQFSDSQLLHSANTPQTYKRVVAPLFLIGGFLRFHR
jgi:hypothetical protein